MRQKKRKTTEKETRNQRRHDSLHCPESEMQQILTERHSAKNETIDKVVCFNLSNFAV